MTQSQQLSEDLSYVRHAVARRETTQNIPPAIAWAVAVYVGVGYAMLDFQRGWSGLFFLVGGLALGVVCWLMGRRESYREGQFDRDEVMRIWLHWGSIVLAITGVIGLAMSRGLRGEIVGQYIALTIGIIYFLGGVHFDRTLLWLGPILMAGSIAISYVPRYGWTALGIVIALGLVIPTLVRARPVRVANSDAEAG